MNILKSNRAILEALDEYVIGHTEAKKVLITMVMRSRMRWYQKYMKEMDSDYLLSPMKILLIGQSGTGKTHLVNSLQKIVHFPFVRVDATDLTPTGAGDGVKSDTLKKLIRIEAERVCDEHPEYYFSRDGAIDRMVIFVDEIDKLGVSFESSGHWNKHVQSNFLTLFDDKQEYSGISYIFAGAFASMETAPKQSSTIGFTCNNGAKTQKEECIDEKVLRSGLIPELVGRINSICELDVFTQENYLNILKTVILPKKLLDLSAFHIFDAQIPDDKLEEIAKNAASSGQGVRFLSRAVDKLCLDIEFAAEGQLLIG